MLIVTYESPLPSLPVVFPTNVNVRFRYPDPATGVTVSTARPNFLVEVKSCRQIVESTALAAVDEETIACGALVRCRLDPAADKDSFKFMAAAGNAVD